MDEKLKKTPPSEILRQNLLATSSATSREKASWTPGGRAHAVANGMPWLFGFFKGAEDSRSRIQAPCQEALTTYAADAGLDSLHDLRTALVNLRQQLRGELPEEKWNEYFDGTLEIS